MSTAIVGTRTLTTGNKAYASDLNDLMVRGTVLKTWSYTDWDATSDYPLSGLGYLTQYQDVPMILMWNSYAGTDYMLYKPQFFVFHIYSEDHYKYGWQHYLYFHKIDFVNDEGSSAFRILNTLFTLAHGLGTGGDSSAEYEPSDLRGEHMRIISRSCYITNAGTSSTTNGSRSTFSSSSYSYPYKLIKINMGLTD